MSGQVAQMRKNATNVGDITDIDTGRKLVQAAVRNNQFTTQAGGYNVILPGLDPIYVQGTPGEMPSQAAIARAFGLPYEHHPGRTAEQNHLYRLE